MGTFRTIAIVSRLLFALLIAWLRGRRRNKARRDATSYVIERLRQDQAARLPSSGRSRRTRPPRRWSRRERSRPRRSAARLVELVEASPRRHQPTARLLVDR